MTIPAWVVWVWVAFLAFGAIGKVAIIGEPRKPITKIDAVASMVVNGALIVVLTLWMLR